MSTESTEARVLNILALVLKESREDLSRDTSSASTERWDSLRHMMIILAIEEEFEIDILENEIAELTSASKIIGALEARENHSK